MTAMTNSKSVTAYITERLEYLDRFIYHHECNIPEPNFQEQSEYHQAYGERQALQKVQQLLSGDTVIEEEGIVFEVSSGFGHNTQMPYVQVLIPKANWMTQMPPESARELALSLLACADAAESDGFLVTFVRERIGVDDMRAVASLLVEFREYREKLRQTV